MSNNKYNRNGNIAQNNQNFNNHQNLHHSNLNTASSTTLTSSNSLTVPSLNHIYSNHANPNNPPNQYTTYETQTHPTHPAAQQHPNTNRNTPPYYSNNHITPPPAKYAQYSPTNTSGISPGSSNPITMNNSTYLNNFSPADNQNDPIDTQYLDEINTLDYENEDSNAQIAAAAESVSKTVVNDFINDIDDAPELMRLLNEESPIQTAEEATEDSTHYHHPATSNYQSNYHSQTHNNQYQQQQTHGHYPSSNSQNMSDSNQHYQNYYHTEVLSDGISNSPHYQHQIYQPEQPAQIIYVDQTDDNLPTVSMEPVSIPHSYDMSSSESPKNINENQNAIYNPPPKKFIKQSIATSNGNHGVTEIITRSVGDYYMPEEPTYPHKSHTSDSHKMKLENIDGTLGRNPAPLVIEQGGSVPVPVSGAGSTTATTVLMPSTSTCITRKNEKGEIEYLYPLQTHSIINGEAIPVMTSQSNLNTTTSNNSINSFRSNNKAQIITDGPPIPKKERKTSGNKSRSSNNAKPKQPKAPRPSKGDADYIAKRRHPYTKEQIARLEIEFGKQEFIQKDHREVISRDLGLTDRQVKIWFQNR